MAKATKKVKSSGTNSVNNNLLSIIIVYATPQTTITSIWLTNDKVHFDTDRAELALFLSMDLLKMEDNEPGM